MNNIQNNLNIKHLEQRLLNNGPRSQKPIENKKDNISFKEILVEKQNEIVFSKHAKERMENRNIRLTETDMEKLNQAFEKAKDKGVKDALILLDNQAFIANMNKNIVITAIGEEGLKDNIFTNIDGAVII